MRKLKSVLLYTALGLLANIGQAQSIDLSVFLQEDMAKLTLHPEPVATSDVAFTSAGGAELTLADFKGKTILVNFWATWCAPCREEMPQLSSLQAQLGSEPFEVVTIATGRNPRPAMEAFFKEIGVDNLPLHTDARQSFARSMGVLGLPVTVIIGPDGFEVGRLMGDADWASESAIALLTAITNGE
ncbi:MAG: TlpA disulfide reductase family protein [Yoonia sp.]|nr:TlpA disulfide reductase family protein [Yoonia sp.]